MYDYLRVELGISIQTWILRDAGRMKLKCLQFNCRYSPAPGIVCFHIGNELLVQLHLARLFDQTQNTLLPV